MNQPVSRYNIEVRFHQSADKWAVPRRDAAHVARYPIRVVVLEDNDQYKELRIDFGLDGRPLEVVMLGDPAGSISWLLIHAMPLRKYYHKYLPGQDRG